jgi:hypothetical protein
MPQSSKFSGVDFAEVAVELVPPGLHGRDAAVLPPHEVSAIIASSGFDSPVLFMQTLFVHAWYAIRT